MVSDTNFKKLKGENICSSFRMRFNKSLALQAMMINRASSCTGFPVNKKARTLRGPYQAFSIDLHSLIIPLPTACA